MFYCKLAIMSDRLVRKVIPAPEPGESPKPFSAYLESANIVLLGDPGAGKSHLFRQFAAATAGARLLARNFLNLDVDSLADKKILFIDALDEKRAGRGDQDTIDAIVKKLFIVKPERVRIACRAADWLGETDLAAFQDYFERKGGVVVLSLEPLSDDERAIVLRERGVPKPEQFLAEARDRGLEELLANPQNLIMLSDVVQKGSWPASRTELFAGAVDLLLSEHSVARAQRESGSYLSSELFEEAGALCAVRLISDIDGISLSASSPSNNLPSYRSLDIGDPGKVQAALGRRVFLAGPAPETVDYTHRTIAEYLAASWVADRVRAGLPIGRVRALIGVEGRPTSELRGLHAWLTVSLPEYAATLIDADPFGVLSYGDAATLGPDHRKHLVEALARLAEIDPWFRGMNRSSSAVAALSGLDMVERFRAILGDQDAPLTLRSVVLDALIAGAPLPELRSDLLALLKDPTRPYAEREASLEGLLRFGTDTAESVASAYGDLGVSKDDLRLRAAILRDVYRAPLGKGRVVALLVDAMAIKDELVGGAFWRLQEAIPNSDVGGLLDDLETRWAPSGAGHDSRNAIEVLYIVDKLLVRFLSLHSDVTGERLWAWLNLRRRIEGRHGRETSDELRRALSSNVGALARLIDVAIRSFAIDDQRWQFMHELREATLSSIEDSFLRDRIVHSLDYETGEKREFLYEMALMLTFHSPAEVRSHFERLYHYADGDEALEAVRTGCCVCEIPDWRTEQRDRRRRQEAERETGRTANRANFEEDREKIRSGAHFGWLGWIGHAYFARFTDVDHEAEPRERLVAELGEENAQVALDGLVALVRSGQITEMHDVIRMNADRKYFKWWFAVIAGLDEYTKAGFDSDALPDSYVRAVFAIDCLYPTYWREGNTNKRIEHPWKADLLVKRPQLAVDAYSALARSSLARGDQPFHGLHELMDLKALVPFRTAVAMSLLEGFPAAPAQALRHLLPAALAAGNFDNLHLLVRGGLSACQAEDRAESRSLWLAAGVLVAPVEFRLEVERLEKEAARAVIWAIRDLSGHRRWPTTERSALSIEQLEFVARLTASHYERAEFPPTTFWGDTNPWDATDLVHQMINLISADASAGASEALARLLTDPAMASYRDPSETRSSTSSEARKPCLYARRIIAWFRAAWRLLDFAARRRARTSVLVR